jgi:hypothetical protein
MNETSSDPDQAGIRRVRIISIVFAVLAILIFISASNLIFVKLAAKPPAKGELSRKLGPGRFLIDNLLTLATLQCAFAAFVFVCAFRFHRYRRWARRALEGTAVIMGVVLASGFALFVRAISGFAPPATSPSSGGPPGFVVVVFVSFGVISILVVMAMIWASLRSLRNPHVIRIVSQSGF